jgi:RNA polymerase sigma-54 factor
MGSAATGRLALTIRAASALSSSVSGNPRVMKPSLQTKLGQQLTLTPQLRQAIRLLQLSTSELEAEINLALESNPLLERAEDAIEDETDAQDSGIAANAPEADRDGADPQAPEAQEFERDWETEEREIDYIGNTGTTSVPSPDFPDYAEREAAAVPDGLQDHLLWQLHLTPLSERDRRIGAALIEAIDDDGYLRDSLQAIRDGLRPEIVAGIDEIDAMRHRIQRFDPVGVAACDLSECLGVQLSLLSADTPGLALAKQLAATQLETLAKLGAGKLAEQLGHPAQDMAEAVALLRSLDPRPGGQIASAPPDYITPDCVAFRQGGVWRVALANGAAPLLAINRRYEGLIGKASREDAGYLRAQLQEARWLIRSLETRAVTVLRVAQAIVRQQTGFLEYGPEAMRPLTLRDVAEQLGLHESTISRSTTRKYLLTPRGTFEFKSFFSSCVATGDGGAASSTAIQAMIRKLIEVENPRKPLSDAKLAAELKVAGVPVARRTVAKYREAMNIPASSERQRLG